MHHRELAEDMSAVGTQSFHHEAADRNVKQAILQDTKGEEFEISTPVGNLLPLFLQDQTYLQNCELDLRFVVNSHFKEDMLFSKRIPQAPRNQGLTLVMDERVKPQCEFRRVWLQRRNAHHHASFSNHAS